MKYKTLEDFNLKNKRVLLRLDLNTELINGKVQFSERMNAHLQTLNELKSKGAKTVIIAHQSRPGEKDFTSLKQHAQLLSKAMARGVERSETHINSEPVTFGVVSRRRQILSETTSASNSRANKVKYNKVKFVPDILGKKAIKAILSLKPGETLLLENIRSLKEEFSSK